MLRLVKIMFSEKPEERKTEELIAWVESLIETHKGVIHPWDVERFRLRAQIYRMERDGENEQAYQQCITGFKRALEVGDESAAKSFYHQAAAFLERIEGAETALSFWTSLPEELKGEITYILHMGRLCRAVGRLTEAKEYLEKALHLLGDINVADYHYQLKMNYPQQSFESTKAYFQSAAALVAYINICQELALVYEALGDKSSSECYAQQARKASDTPFLPDMKTGRGFFLQHDE
ncbi:MAG: hypothetical protein NZT92_22470 [Abditibacteriales bacterium]|nr:hypothetical protein [Abditibacteriales bacterium]